MWPESYLAAAEEEYEVIYFCPMGENLTDDYGVWDARSKNVSLKNKKFLRISFTTSVETGCQKFEEQIYGMCTGAWEWTCGTIKNWTELNIFRIIVSKTKL